MDKIEKIIFPATVACTAQQLYLLGTFNPDGALFLQTQAFVCYIPGPPEGMVLGVVASEQTKENITRERMFSLNQCSVDMRSAADLAWQGYTPGNSGEGMFSYSNGSKLHVPVLDVSPHVLECKVTQTLSIGDTLLVVSETLCIHADHRYVPPIPESGDLFDWYTDQDAKLFNPLLYSVKYYSLSDSIGQLDIKNW